jgi:NDP-sugar pyrophosphorylase family protein
MLNVTQGVVLAAGEGRRLRPVTESLPKPLVPFFGRPLIDWAVDKLVEAGCERIAVNAYHAAPLIMRHVSALSARLNGVELHVAREERLLGTGGAIANLRSWLAPQPFYVINSDAVLSADLSELEAHAPNPALLVTRSALYKDQRRLLADSRGLWTGLDEGGAECGYTFCGISVADADLPQRLPRSGPSCILRQGFLPYLAANPVRLIETHGFFADTGTPESLVEAHVHGLEWVRSRAMPLSRHLPR